jgi:hypothetical protein
MRLRLRASFGLLTQPRKRFFSVSATALSTLEHQYALTISPCRRSNAWRAVSYLEANARSAVGSSRLRHQLKCA